MVRYRQVRRSYIKILFNNSGGMSGGMSGGKSSGNVSAMNHYTQEVVRALFSGLPMAIAGNAVLAVILAAVQSAVVTSQNITWWLLAMVFALVWRTAVLLAYRRHYDADRAVAWLWHFRVSTITNGLVWALAAVLLYPSGDITTQVFLAFVLAGVSAGALISLQMDRVAALGFALPALLSLALAFTLQTDNVSRAMGLMIFIYVAFYLMASQRATSQLQENYHLRTLSLADQDRLMEQQRLTALITRAQSSFIHEKDRHLAFDVLLADVLALTSSEYGFIAETRQSAEGYPYLKTYAITDIAWSDETRDFYRDNAPQGMEFCNLDTLFGAALTSGKPVIANDAYNDPRRGGLPEGHPALNAFLGVPVFHGDKLIAVLGLANRPGGYDQALIDFLQPLLIALGQMVTAVQLQLQHSADQLELARMSQVASQTTNGVLITDAEGRVEWINEGFTRITGYTLTEIYGYKPGELLQGADTNPQTVAEIRAALAQGKGFECDLLNYSKDGKPYWIRIQCNALRDENNVLQSFIAIESDVTRQKEDQQQLERQLVALATLNDIASSSLGIDEQLERALRLGADFLGLEVGIISRILHDDYEVAVFVAPSASPLERGQHFPLGNTYCALTLAENDLVAIEHMATSGHRGHPCYGHFGLEAYIGSMLEVGGKPIGTLNFSSAQLRPVPFSEGERMFVRLLARWVSTSLEKQQNHDRLEKLISHVPGMVYQYQQWPDGSTAFSYSSPGILEIYGVTAREARQDASKVFRILHPEDLNRVQESINRSMKNMSTWALQYRTLRDDGIVRWLEGHATPEAIDDGSTVWHGYIRDITDEKRAGQAIASSEARLRGLFTLSPIGIALNDYETGAFLELNEALLRPTGYTREEFIALSYWDVTPKEYEAQEALQLECLEKTGQYGPYEKEYIHKDGSRYPVLLNGMVVYDNDDRKLIWSIVEDISERRRIDRMKSEFISTVSHELRTPLTAISGALGLLVGGAAGTLPVQLGEILDIAHKNSQRLGYLINDLLDMEKLLAGKMHFEMQVQALYPLLEQSVKDNQGYADRFGVSLVLDAADEEVQVKVDALRLHQMLANLLSNAAKFSPEGANVLISLVTDKDRVRVSIADQGPGIPDSFRDRIFQKFSQADSSDTRSKSGTGLGLAITRELVERMHGSVGFDSVPGAGATFYFELPLATGESRSKAC